MVDIDKLRTCNAQQTRTQLGDGNYGGYYQRADAEMMALWAIAVEETRASIDSGWD